MTDIVVKSILWTTEKYHGRRNSPDFYTNLISLHFESRRKHGDLFAHIFQLNICLVKTNTSKKRENQIFIHIIVVWHDVGASSQ